jgi:hypothetical protein
MSLADGFRVAVYYAPERDDPLWRAGTQWLGRDPESGEAFPIPDAIGDPGLIAEPSAYGFHGTLKPPMRLADGRGYEEFLDAVRQLALGLRPFDLPQFSVQNLNGFLAVREAEPSPALQALADVTVASLDSFRAQPSEAELARRRKGGLSPAEESMLSRWGYPYVFQLWRFHLTLSRRLSEGEMARLRPSAEAWFDEAFGKPRRCQSLAVYTQRASGAPFELSDRITFG